jgi:hypothetical protein
MFEWHDLCLVGGKKAEEQKSFAMSKLTLPPSQPRREDREGPREDQMESSYNGVSRAARIVPKVGRDSDGRPGGQKAG